MQRRTIATATQNWLKRWMGNSDAFFFSNHYFNMKKKTSWAGEYAPHCYSKTKRDLLTDCNYSHILTVVEVRVHVYICKVSACKTLK